MPKEELDRFGKLLIQRVRDDVITLLDATIDGRLAGQAEEPFGKITQSLSPDSAKALHALMPLAVDMTLQFFLSFIEQTGGLDLVINQTGDALSLKKLSAGLSDELHQKSGWIARFSQQRSYETDIFKDEG
jgi:hypothetical protein